MGTTGTGRGIFGGFEGFRIPGSEVTSSALKTAMVSIDANVLLDLYRYSDELTTTMLSSWESLGDRLFVSDQALSEFWRNRATALEDRARAKSEVLKRFGEVQKSLVDSVTTWARKISLDDDELDETNHLVARLFESLRSRVSMIHGEDSENYPSPVLDPIVQRLQPLLEGRVGDKSDDSVWAADVAEGKSRHKAQRPPGFKEKEEDKVGLKEGVAGDYLVWVQSMRAAAERRLDLLLVTRDEKDDWWWRSRSLVLGPRPELAAEYWNLASKQLYMMTPSTFITAYGQLGGAVSEAAIIEAEGEGDLATRRGESDSDSVTDVVGHWTHDGLNLLLERLDAEAPVQAESIRTAAATGGRITREKIFEIGGFPPDRMLRGFTRPVRRLTSWLQGQGIVLTNVPPAIEPEYDLYGTAVAFKIPKSVVELLAIRSEV